MKIEQETRIKVILLELELLQTRFANYDDLVWKSRGGAIVLVSALMGWGAAADHSGAYNPMFFAIAAVVTGMAWFHECIIRFASVHKYIIRYRRIRDLLNTPDCDLDELPLYDLTNHIEGRGALAGRLKESFLVPERFFFYAVLLAASLFLWRGCH